MLKATRHVLVFLAAVASLISSGCDGGGMIRTEDGQWLGMSADNVRENVESTIDASADAELGAHWRCETKIDEQPYRDTDDWLWQHATAHVDLVGDGQAPLPITHDEVERAVRTYLARRVDRPTKNLTITVADAVDAPRFARIVSERTKGDRHTAPTTTAAAPQPSPTTTPTSIASVPPPAANRYTIQAGDTLAALSSVFYGSPQYWRRLVEANPGLDPAALPVGTAITVPPAP